MVRRSGPSLALEGRVFLEAAALLPALPLLALAPRGDGHPVLVLPGWRASDRSTAILRRFLSDRGYLAYDWALGRNEGPTREIQAGLVTRLIEISKRHGRTVSLIGWSLGGVYARALARQLPDRVRQVITLASPYRFRETATPLPVPTTSIYSRSDAIVSWKNCVEEEGPRRENVEVDSSHLGMGHHPRVLLVIADRLAQPEGVWRSYRQARRARGNST